MGLGRPTCLDGCPRRHSVSIFRYSIRAAPHLWHHCLQHGTGQSPCDRQPRFRSFHSFCSPILFAKDCGMTAELAAVVVSCAAGPSRPCFRDHDDHHAGPCGTREEAGDIIRIVNGPLLIGTGGAGTLCDVRDVSVYRGELPNH